MNASVKKIHCFVTRMIHSLAPRRSLSFSVTPSLNRPIQPPHSLAHLLILAFVSKHAPRSQLKLFGGKQAGRHAIPSPRGKRSSADPSQRRSYLSSFFVLGRTFLQQRDLKKKKKKRYPGSHEWFLLARCDSARRSSSATRREVFCGTRVHSTIVTRVLFRARLS